LTDGLRRRTGLEINDSFWERLRTQGRDFVAKEWHFGNMENALGRIQKDTVILEFGKEGTEVLVVLFRGMAKDKDVV
jgi:hypothetical protein